MVLKALLSILCPFSFPRPTFTKALRLFQWEKAPRGSHQTRRRSTKGPTRQKGTKAKSKPKKPSNTAGASKAAKGSPMANITTKATPKPKTCRKEAKPQPKARNGQSWHEGTPKPPKAMAKGQRWDKKAQTSPESLSGFRKRAKANAKGQN